MQDKGAPQTVESPLPDDEIVARVCAGEASLFELVMRRYNARIFRAVRAIVRDNDEAEDVMQQAYVNAYVHLAAFEGRASLSTWLTRIAVHEALARARQSKKWSRFDDDDSTEYPAMTTMSQPARNPEKSAGDRELLGVLEDAIDALPGVFRAVFVLRVLEEMSAVETGQALDIPEETVKTRLFRARGLLKDALMERAGAATPRAFEFHLSRCDRVVAAVLRKIAGASRTSNAETPIVSQG
jgi:RNA polymerase sigma-70 factor (ECF subfamily)